MTDTSGDRSRLGFIGLGNMGGRMVERLTSAGLEVLAFDSNADALTRRGVRAAATAAAVAADSDIVFLSLPDSRIIERVVLGEDGLAETATRGSVVVDFSTAAPSSTRMIERRLAEKGVTYLDAGISGGAAAAEKGALTLMVGGDEAALDRIRPYLTHIASTVVLMGASGAGHTTKLLNNFLNAISLSATAEVMVAAKKAGLDLEAVLEVINASSGVNFATLNRFPNIIKGDYMEGGLSNALMMKDVILYVDHLHELGVSSVNAAGPLSAFGLAIALGYSASISNTVVDALGDVSGHVRLHEAN